MRRAENHLAEESMAGKAYLVGAGPGRADLITVRGLTLLRQADVILYDHLIAPELLAEAPPHAKLVFVGKVPGRHLLEQDEINRLLIMDVQAGQQVVRLKGGDPFIFGRGGEEALALVQAGLPFEVVPGVSSISAAPAYAGVPLTHREISNAFAVVTGHEAPGKTYQPEAWAALAHLPTLVILMPVKGIATTCTALLAAGRAATTPALAISWGTTDQQQTLQATLATLPAELLKEQLPTPVMIVIGEVVNLAATLAWFNPDGKAQGFMPLQAEN